MKEVTENSAATSATLRLPTSLRWPRPKALTSSTLNHTTNHDTEKNLHAFASFCSALFHRRDGRRLVALFDGTSLDGWRAAENPKAFTVKDETLVVNGERGHFLVWQRRTRSKWDDLNLAMVRTQPVQTVVSSSTPNSRTGWPDVGYECQVNATHGDSIKLVRSMAS